LEGRAAVGELTGPLVVFAVRDRITCLEGAVRTIIVGLQQREGGMWEVLRDWEILKFLNPIADKPRSQMPGVAPRMEREITALLADAQKQLESRMEKLDIPFRLPAIESLAACFQAS
jgi:hypothetical protein